MKFYAYIPDEDGREPLGTNNKLLFELKTKKGAFNRTKRIFESENFRLFWYTNFYNDSSFHRIFDESMTHEQVL
jgi:hypothetical protein